MKVRNILALCCTIILSLISCSKDKGPIKDTLSGSEWTWSGENSSDKFRVETHKLKFTSETEGIFLVEFDMEDRGGHTRKNELRVDFRYELKGSSITLMLDDKGILADSDGWKIESSGPSTVVGTLDREKGTIEFRDTKDGKEVSYIYHRSK